MINSSSRQCLKEINNISCRWIKRPPLEYLDSILFNRLDLSYDHGIYWMDMDLGQSSCLIPIYVDAGREWISLLLVVLDPSELQFIF